MPNELQPLSVLFQNRLFRIPDYQRGYAWKESQLIDFWDDLLNLHEDRYHYTGLLSLKTVSRKETALWSDDTWLLDIGYKPFHVVDGQQRLTTFSILLFEIVMLVKNLPENVDKPDEAIFIGYESLKDIKAKYILRKRPPQNFITTYLFGYETDDVFVAFETMNNRGKKLTNLELLKNRLIYLTTLFDDAWLDQMSKDALRKKINDAWKEVYYQLGRNQNAPLSDDDFLRAHWITYFQYSRKRGDDYIRFLLGKFSAKNIFEKHTVMLAPEADEPLPGFDGDDEDENGALRAEPEPVTVSRLDPKEIGDYVNSLKALAEHWYYSFFPNDSPDLSDEEKLWIDRLNRVGIGHFRPLVAAALATGKKTEPSERVALLKAIERFIFVAFRIGTFQASYKSSDYYNKARDILSGAAPILDIAADLNATTTKDMPSALKNFQTRTDRRFESGEGFYGWRDLRYFLYEYECELARTYGKTKIDGTWFANVPKDKLTIEHILPQTPTTKYWRDQFRNYTATEIKLLSASLGNLLPLSHSINASLQNNGFPEKKQSLSGRVGYQHGCHSEIEVANEADWDAGRILERGMELLRFMERRWNIEFDDEDEMLALLHIPFVREQRESAPEIVVPDVYVETTEDEPAVPERRIKRLAFWTAFTDYCKQIGREEDIASRKPSGDDWYDISVGNRDYHIFLQILRQKKLRVGIYVYNQVAFKRLEDKKEEIENYCGFQFEWYTSRAKSVQNAYCTQPPLTYIMKRSMKRTSTGLYRILTR